MYTYTPHRLFLPCDIEPSSHPVVCSMLHRSLESGQNFVTASTIIILVLLYYQNITMANTIKQVLSIHKMLYSLSSLNKQIYIFFTAMRYNLSMK